MTKKSGVGYCWKKKETDADGYVKFLFQEEFRCRLGCEDVLLYWKSDRPFVETTCILQAGSGRPTYQKV